MHGEAKEKRSKLSKLSDIRKRIIYLGWNNGIIANYCANVKANACALIKQKEAKVGVDRKRKNNSRIGIKRCSGCDIVFEVVLHHGHTRSEFHIYTLLSTVRKMKAVCPYCTGESSKYAIIQ